MSTSNIDETAPVKVSKNLDTNEPQKKEKPRRVRLILLGILLILVLAAAGSFLGYRAAINDRLLAEKGELALVTTTQFELAEADFQAGRLAMARDRFEYVVQLDPSFPGIEDKLSEVMLQMALTSVPTEALEPTPTIEPTIDFSGSEEIFSHADQLMRNAQWSAAIQTLDILRKEDLTYRSIEADGMYYIALRNRGIDKIIKEGNLEGGIYDLTLASNFAPLDKDAVGYIDWARLYLTGSSVWEIDWKQVVSYFSQIYAALPNLRDGDGWTAMERYRVASMKYGDQLMIAGEYCAGRDQYENALMVGVDNALVPTATKAQLLCQPPTATPRPATATPEFISTEIISVPTTDTTSPAATNTTEPIVVPTETQVPTAAPTTAP